MIYNLEILTQEATLKMNMVGGGGGDPPGPYPLRTLKTALFFSVFLLHAICDTFKNPTPQSIWVHVYM